MISCAVGDWRKRTTHRKILNERTIAYYLCRVTLHAIAVCDTHYLNTCNFVILCKFLINFYTATQSIVAKNWQKFLNVIYSKKKVMALCLRVQIFLSNHVHEKVFHYKIILEMRRVQVSYCSFDYLAH